MEVLKSMEIALRRLLLRTLRFVIKRRGAVPHTMDFNRAKFLFVRQDRIGDVLISTPLISVLKKHYPQATIDFLLSSNNHFVLANEPLVHKRWIYRKSVGSAVSLVRSIRNERYDFVIDLMDNPSITSTVICGLAGGRWNVGLSKENEYAYDISVPLLSRRETHIVDRLAVLLTVFGIRPEEERLEVRYVVSKESQDFAGSFFDREGLQGRFVVGLNISPGSGVRFWGVSNFQHLVRMLLAEYPQFRVLVLYQPSDRRQAEDIVRPIPEVTLSPLTQSFDEFAALVRLLSLLVTPDTSAVHLAAAFQVPSVVLYVQSNKELRIWEPYGSDSETLVTDVDDLTTIPPERVFQALKRLVERPKAARVQSQASNAEIS